MLLCDVLIERGELGEQACIGYMAGDQKLLLGVEVGEEAHELAGGGGVFSGNHGSEGCRIWEQFQMDLWLVKWSWAFEDEQHQRHANGLFQSQRLCREEDRWHPVQVSSCAAADMACKIGVKTEVEQSSVHCELECFSGWSDCFPTMNVCNSGTTGATTR